MFSSGISKLDELLGGGVEEGRIVLIETIGELGEEIAMNFVAEALKSGENVFLILGRRKVRDIKKMLKSRGVEDENRLTIITSTELGYKTVDLYKLYTISFAIRQEAKKNKLCSIEILQPLLILHGSQKIYNFFLEVVNLLKKEEVTGIFTIDKKLSKPRTLAMFEEQSDVVIEIEELLKWLKIERGIRVKKNPLAPHTDFYELKITEKGIEIGERIV